MTIFGENSIFSSLNSAGGATSLAIMMLVILGFIVATKVTGFRFIDVLHKIVGFFMKIFARLINKKETQYHRDIEIGKLTEKRKTVKLYRFLSELIIDLDMRDSGVTPYELLALISITVTIITTVICKLLFGSFLMTIILTPIVIVGTFCIMYTKANVAHDARIEAVIEAENILCNNIQVGVLVAVRENLNVLPKIVRPDFKAFVDNMEHKNYHIKTALLELNARLGSVADDFIKKCIVFEMEEEHGIAGMFMDIIEINNVNMKARVQMKRHFEEVKTEFIMGACMIFVFLGGVLAIYPTVRDFYFTTFIGQLILILDVMLLIAEFVYITYLRAKEL